MKIWCGAMESTLDSGQIEMTKALRGSSVSGEHLEYVENCRSRVSFVAFGCLDGQT